MDTSNDIVFYTFSRSKIEAGDFRHFLSLFSTPPAPRRLRELMNKLVFAVEGYDADPREVHSIPEVRTFYQAFFKAWPYWLYYGNLDTDNLRTMVCCCLPSITAVKVNQSGNVAVEMNQGDLREFMAAAVPPMHRLFEKASLFPDLQRKRDEEVMQYFGVPSRKSPIS